MPRGRHTSRHRTSTCHHRIHVFDVDPVVDATVGLRASHPDLAFVGSDYSYLQEWLPNVALADVRAGRVGAVGIGRMALSYHDLHTDVVEGRGPDRRRICRTFSGCTMAPRNGLVSDCYPKETPARVERSG